MLEFEPFSIPFAGGLDTKSDPKRLAPGKLLRLENGEFVRGTAVRGRKGYSAINDAPIAPVETAEFTLAEGVYGTKRGLGAFGNQLAVLTSRGAYVYAEAPNQLSYIGPYSPMTHTLEPFASGNVEQVGGETATTGGITVQAWVENRVVPGDPEVVWAVVDNATGAVLGSTTTGQGYYQPSVVAIGAVLLVVFADSTNDSLRYYRILPDDIAGSLAAAHAELVPDLNAANRYTICQGTDDHAYLFYDSDDTVVAGMRVMQVLSSGAIGAVGAVSTDTPTSNLSIAYDADSDTVLVGWGRLSGTDDVQLNDFDGTTLAAGGSSAGSAASSTITRVAVGFTQVGENLGWFTAYTEDNASEPITHFYTIDTVTADDELMASIRQATVGRGAFYDGEQSFVLLYHDSRGGLQHSFYLYSWAGDLLGQVLYRVASDTGASDLFVPQVREVDGMFVAGLGCRTRLDARTDDIAVFEHVKLKRAVFNPSAPVVSDQLGGGLYLSGSMLWHIDGQVVEEAGLLMYPDMLASDIAETGTGFAQAGDRHTYRVYYCKRALSGEVFRSAALTLNYDVVGANKKLQLVIPTLPFAADPDSIWIEVYRGTANAGTILRKVTSSDPTAVGVDNGWLDNDPTVDSVTFVDDMDDTDIASQAIDYLTAGEAPNFPPPGPSCVRFVSDRLFVTGGACENNQVWFSKPYVPGEPATFSDALVTSGAPGAKGTIQAIGQMGDSPVLFEQFGAFTISGRLPNNFAVDGDYAVQRIPVEVGCSAPNTVVSTSFGIAFFSAKGFYLMKPDYSVEYFGAPIERANSRDYAAGVVIPDTDLMVWVASDGYAAMFDYFYGQWGEWTNHEGLAGVVWGGNRFAYLRTDDSVYIRDTSLFSDNGFSFTTVVRTAPIRPFDSAIRWWKLERFQVLGEWFSPHTLRCKLYYNRELEAYQTFTHDPADNLNLEGWGTGTWGVGTWGGTPNPNNPLDYHFEKRPKRSWAQTVSFEFECIPSESAGAIVELSELLISAAPVAGMSRIPAGRKL